MKLSRKVVSSPVGDLRLVASDTGLVAVLWSNDSPGRVRLQDVTADPEHPVLVHTARELEEYFAGARKSFTVPLDMRGTEFQKQVWSALLAVPFGETRTYAQIAGQIGRPKSSRAVGAANGRNPLSILVPCHRIVGTSGELTGFAGGLDAKAFLLQLEGSRLC